MLNSKLRYNNFRESCATAKRWREEKDGSTGGEEAGNSINFYFSGKVTLPPSTLRPAVPFPPSPISPLCRTQTRSPLHRGEHSPATTHNTRYTTSRLSAPPSFRRAARPPAPRRCAPTPQRPCVAASPCPTASRHSSSSGRCCNSFASLHRFVVSRTPMPPLPPPRPPRPPARPAGPPSIIPFGSPASRTSTFATFNGSSRFFERIPLHFLVPSLSPSPPGAPSHLASFAASSRAVPEPSSAPPPRARRVPRHDATTPRCTGETL